MRFAAETGVEEDEIKKENGKSCESSRYLSTLRKKNSRYLCLQKHRMGMIIEEERNVERHQSQLYGRHTSDIRSCDKLSITEERNYVKILDKNIGNEVHTESTRIVNSNQYVKNTFFESESDTESFRNQKIRSWLSGISHCSNECNSICERPPTGSSEDGNFHFHPSTSASDTTASRNIEKSSDTSETSSAVSPTMECRKSDYEIISGEEREIFDPESPSDEVEMGAIKWESGLVFDRSEEASGKDETMSETRWRSNAKQLSGQDGNARSPLKYNLKYENLEVSILDSSSQLTVRFISEKDHDSKQESKHSKLKVTSAGSGSSSEIFLPVETSTQHSGHFSPTHQSDVPEINNIGNVLQMAVERLNLGESLNSGCQNTSNVIGNDLSNNSHGQPNELRENKKLQSDVINTENMNPFTLPPMEDAVMQKPLSTGLDENQTYTLRSRDRDTLKMDVNASGIDYSKIDGPVDGQFKKLDPSKRLQSSEDSRGFVFESEIMKINYEPDSNSDSVELSFRRQRGVSKLTFKSKQKKLYLKMAPSSFKY